MNLQKEDVEVKVFSDDFLKDYDCDVKFWLNYQELFQKFGRDATAIYKMVCYIMFDTLTVETGYAFDDNAREYLSDICVNAYLLDKSNTVDLSLLAYFVGKQILNGNYKVSQISNMSAGELITAMFCEN